MTKKRKTRYDVKTALSLNTTLLKTNLMKRIFMIVPRNLKKTLKKIKQVIRQIKLNPRK